MSPKYSLDLKCGALPAAGGSEDHWCVKDYGHKGDHHCSCGCPFIAAMAEPQKFQILTEKGNGSWGPSAVMVVWPEGLTLQQAHSLVGSLPGDNNYQIEPFVPIPLEAL